MDKEKFGKAKKDDPAHRSNIKRALLRYRERLTDVFTRVSTKKARAKKTLEINAKAQQGEAIAEPRLKEKVFVPKESSQEMGPAPQYKSPEEFCFPPGYGDNRIVIMTRDPWWIFAYWEITKQKEEEVKAQIAQKGFLPLKSILRVYDIPERGFNGGNANNFFDIDLTGLANNWYINVGTPNRSWIVDIGILTTNNEFFFLARSNCVRTPRFGMSDVIDEEWMCLEDDYWRMFGLSGGFGMGKASMAMREMFKKRLMQQISSGGWSGAVSSISSPVKKKAQKGFWLVADCELIVYGQTEPDAKVTVQGKPIHLRKDGTFTLRYALPDGKQEIPVVATSFEGDDTRTITPIVTRRTI